MRNTATFAITDYNKFKQQVLYWSNSFSTCCFLDNNFYQDKFNSHECIVAVDIASKFTCNKNILQQFKLYCNSRHDWLFGHINYDVKNEIENLSSQNPDYIQFPEIFFFVPLTVIQIKQQSATISSIGENPVEIFKKINSFQDNHEKCFSNFSIKPRISKTEYLKIIKLLQKHILRGDCYEINFCQEFFAENAVLDPLAIYYKLNAFSPVPFSAFYKLDNKYLLCASPERFLKKTANKIISQPIKGTYKRNIENALIDEQYKEQLQLSTKDKSENVMVVDLVRNDLSKICEEGTVKVDELFGIYSFPQVHQLISTVSCYLKDGIDIKDILSATFPMGSMTGAPKRIVMELIEKYEHTKRGIFSGTVGYISPEKNFDFNVVIRSILYNATNKYLSYLVGSGITFYSNAEEEYEECILKAKAINEVLNLMPKDIQVK